MMKEEVVPDSISPSCTQFKAFMDNKVSFEEVKEIIKKSPCEPGIPDLFRYCVEKGHLEHVKELIELGVDPSDENYMFHTELSRADILEKAIRSENTMLVKLTVLTQLIASKVTISRSDPLSIQKVCTECNLSLEDVENIMLGTPAWEKLQRQFLYVELDVSQPHGAKLINVTELIEQIKSGSLSPEESKYITITQDGTGGLWHAAMHLGHNDLLLECINQLGTDQEELDNVVLEAISLNNISIAECALNRILSTDQRFRLLNKLNDIYGNDKNEEVKLWVKTELVGCHKNMYLNHGMDIPESISSYRSKYREMQGDFYDKMFRAEHLKSSSIPVNTTDNQPPNRSETEPLTQPAAVVETKINPADLWVTYDPNSRGWPSAEKAVSIQRDYIRRNKITDFEFMKNEFINNPKWRYELPNLIGGFVQYGEFDKVQQIFSYTADLSEQAVARFAHDDEVADLWNRERLLEKAIRSENIQLIKLIASRAVVSSQRELIEIQEACNEHYLGKSEVENIFSDTPVWKYLRRQFAYVEIDCLGTERHKLKNIDQLKIEIEDGSIDFEASQFISIDKHIKGGLFYALFHCGEKQLLLQCLDKVECEQSDLKTLVRDALLSNKPDFTLAKELFERIKSKEDRVGLLINLLKSMYTDEHIDVCQWILDQQLLTDEQKEKCKQHIKHIAQLDKRMDQVKSILQLL